MSKSIIPLNNPFSLHFDKNNYSVSMNDYWVAIDRDEAHISREREKAKALRKTKWWQDRIKEGKCHYCGKTFPGKELSMDHILPVARGGKSNKGNCVVCCKSCNQEKSCLTPAEMIFRKLDEERRKSDLQ